MGGDEGQAAGGGKREYQSRWLGQAYAVCWYETAAGDPLRRSVVRYGAERFGSGSVARYVATALNGGVLRLCEGCLRAIAPGRPCEFCGVGEGAADGEDV